MMPLSDIGKVIRSFPNSTTFFFVVFPLSIIDFSVTPLELALSFSFATNKVTQIVRTIRVVFIAKPFLLSIFEVSLVDLSIMVENKTKSLRHAIFKFQLSDIHSFVVKDFACKGLIRDLVKNLEMRLIMILEPL
jgi:hypothetical protein